MVEYVKLEEEKQTKKLKQEESERRTVHTMNRWALFIIAIFGMTQIWDLERSWLKLVLTAAFWAFVFSTLHLAYYITKDELARLKKR